ncbi:hypothetical protein Ancab_039618 [Ancistrocladus abbreviatus]
MAGAVVSSAANWIGTQLVSEVNFLLEVEHQVRSLQQELEYIALHLREADSAEGEDDEQLRLFTKEIREIAFNAEDVVDNYVLKVASSSSANIGGNFLKKFLRFLCSSCDVHSIGKETEAIRENIKEAVERLNRFRNNHFSAPSEVFNQPRPHENAIQTYPHTEEAFVVGRDADVRDLVHQLTYNIEARVVAIVGTGGAGKTTLARTIYNDVRVKNNFTTTAWITVSQQWNKKDLLFEILRQTKGFSHEERNTIKEWSEREFIEAIHGFLSENSYLLVLDDMWRRDAWDCIYPALPHTGSTRKVMITTRNEGLPLQVGQQCIVHRPQLLTEDQSWELFKKIAVEERGTPVTADENIVKLGKEMTRKCGGLPLGVVTLAGHLRMKDTSEWEGVTRRFNSILLKVQGPPQYGRSIYQTLTLSYYDLPNYLKPCFLYLALFPEDIEIKAKMLTRMWVAEGFVTKHDEPGQINESLEDAAEQCLSELIQRCMVQVVAKSITTGKVKRCRVHDLTRDFCIAKAEEQCFLQVLSSTNQLNISTPVRRVSIHESGSSEVSLPTQCLHIRSSFNWGHNELYLKIVCEDLKFLRVLILYRVGTHDGYLPEEVGSLRHLRHLALIESNITTLPNSIGNLSNLLYLECVHGAEPEVKPLPNVLWKMVQLRHLYLDYEYTTGEELQLHTLTNLQTLQSIDVSGWKSKAELERLSPSLQKLKIVGIERQELFDAMFCSPCMTSGNLVNLWLQWQDGVKLKSIEPLYKHCQHLRKLHFHGEISEDCTLEFPQSLVKLELQNSNCKLHDPLVAIGKLGQLRYLDLVSTFTGAEMTCNADSFPLLEVFFINLENLEEWSVKEGAMPRLRMLMIIICPKLKRLPENLRSIHSLQKMELIRMPSSFCHRLFKRGERRNYEYREAAGAVAADGEEERGEDFHIIQHIPYVSFHLVVGEST